MRHFNDLYPTLNEFQHFFLQSQILPHKKSHCLSAFARQNLFTQIPNP